jgi:drug/metabolite transporter (DMT)-like permease
VPLWIIFSLIAMAASVAKVLTVKHLCQGIDSRLLVLVARITGAVVLIPIMLVVNQSFPIDPVFWMGTFATALITASASIGITEAIKKGPLSLVMPAQAAVPVFTLITLWIMIRQTPDPIAIILICLSMASIAWMLAINYQSEQTQHKQTAYALLSLATAVLFGISTALDRIPISHAIQGGLTYAACWNAVSVIPVSIEFFRKYRKSGIEMPKQGFLLPLVVNSAAIMIALLFQHIAVQQSLDIPGSIVNIKTIVLLHLPIVVLVGMVIFRERISKWAVFAGAIALIAGMLLLRTMM